MDEAALPALDADDDADEGDEDLAEVLLEGAQMELRPGTPRAGRCWRTPAPRILAPRWRSLRAASPRPARRCSSWAKASAPRAALVRRGRHRRRRRGRSPAHRHRARPDRREPERMERGCAARRSARGPRPRRPRSDPGPRLGPPRARAPPHHAARRLARPGARARRARHGRERRHRPPARRGREVPVIERLRGDDEGRRATPPAARCAGSSRASRSWGRSPSSPRRAAAPSPSPTARASQSHATAERPSPSWHSARSWRWPSRETRSMQRCCSSSREALWCNRRREARRRASRRSRDQRRAGGDRMGPDAECAWIACQAGLLAISKAPRH